MSEQRTEAQRTPSDEELASEWGISVERYQQAQREIHRYQLELRLFWMEMGLSLDEINNTPLNVLLDFREMMKRRYP